MKIHLYYFIDDYPLVELEHYNHDSELSRDLMHSMIANNPNVIFFYTEEVSV